MAQFRASLRFAKVLITYPDGILGTHTVIFEMAQRDSGSTALSFRHLGLVSELDCYEQYHAGWESLPRQPPQLRGEWERDPVLRLTFTRMLDRQGSIGRV